MSEYVKRNRPTDSINLNDRREKSKAAIRQLFAQAKRIEEEGLPAQDLDHALAQDAKEFFASWRREKREGKVIVAVAASAIFFFLFTRPDLEIVGNRLADAFIVTAAAGAVWVTLWFATERDIATKRNYVATMLGRLDQVKPGKRDFYIDGLRFHIFGPRKERYRRVLFGVMLVIPLLFGFFALLAKDPILSAICAGFGAIVFFITNILSYWREEKIDEVDDSEQ